MQSRRVASRRSRYRAWVSLYERTSLSRIHVLRKSVHGPACTREPINGRRFYRIVTVQGGRQPAVDGRDLLDN